MQRDAHTAANQLRVPDQGRQEHEPRPRPKPLQQAGNRYSESPSALAAAQRRATSIRVLVRRGSNLHVPPLETPWAAQRDRHPPCHRFAGSKLLD